MPKCEWVTAEEFQELTGERGSWIIEMPPAKRLKTQEVFLRTSHLMSSSSCSNFSRSGTGITP